MSILPQTGPGFPVTFLRRDGDAFEFSVLGVPPDIRRRMADWLAANAPGRHRQEGWSTLDRQPVLLAIDGEDVALRFGEEFVRPGFALPAETPPTSTGDDATTFRP